MKKIFILIFLFLSFVCEGQTEHVDYYKDINYKDIVEISELLYLKADTTLVRGRVVQYNKKKEVKRYVEVVNGEPDESGWINNDDIKYIFTITRKPMFDRYSGNDWQHGQTQYQKNINYMNDVNDRIRRERDNPISDDVEKDSIYNELYYGGTLKTSGSYIKGEKDGLYKEYHYNNKLKKTGNYIDGKKHGLWEEYHENGQLKSKVNYVDGKKVELLQLYHSNGQLKARVNYKDGKEDGEMMVYSEHGEIIMIGFFKDGIQAGEWHYYENGKLIQTVNLN